MPMLKRMMDLGCTLIDYEKIVNEKGYRLIFFGRFAGLAGMIDTLWAYGQRLKHQGISSPLSKIKQTIHYTQHLEEIKNHFKRIGSLIKKQGLPRSIVPLTIGFAGYGNVSKGAQEILDFLPTVEISPEKLSALGQNASNNCLYKIVFKEEHMVAPNSSDQVFELQDYYQHPEKYHSVFDSYLPYLSILMNCIYWDKQYPRLVTKEYLKKVFSDEMKLQVIGDISVDINGAIEFTERATEPDHPVFVYNPLDDMIYEGYRAKGIVVMAVDNLPCELPRESSLAFSTALESFVPAIAEADLSVDYDDLQLPPEIKNAVIVYKGKLTPMYQYIDKYL